MIHPLFLLILALILIGLFLLPFLWKRSLDKMVKKKTEELNKSKDLLEQAQSIARIGSFHWTFDTGKIDYSDRALAMYGIDFKQFDGDIDKALEKAIHPDDREKVRRTNELVRSTNEPVPLLEFRTVEKDGTVRYLLARGKRQYDNHGNRMGLLGVAQDITDYRRSEEKLKLTTDLLHNIINNSMSLIIAKDMSGKYILANKLSERMIEYDVGGMLGKTDDEIFPPVVAAKFKDEDRQVLESRKPVVLEDTLFLKGRYHTFVTTKFPLFDKAGRIQAICGMATDITEQKRTQEKLREYSVRLEEMVAARTLELEKAQKELLVKERLAVLGNLAGSIAHEIRNPLGTIGTSVFLLEKRLGNRDETSRSQLRRIQENVVQVNAIIESLLNLTRKEKPHTEPHDLNDLIPAILKDIEIPHSVEIRVCHSNIPLISALDPAQIRIAVKNIIQNAIQAMQGTGAITTRLGPKRDGYGEIVIIDTGPGIPAENLENIFQPLFSTKVHGIGFGLSITKMIIKKHGGELTVASPPEGGAAFTIALPLVSEEEAVIREKSSAS